MGWTIGEATHYKRGKWGLNEVDRKACMDAVWTWESEDYDGETGHGVKCEVVRSYMYGSTYYAACEITKDGVSKGVSAMVCLTTVKNGLFYSEFGYKDMDETCGPYKYDCPKSILKLLTPIDSEYANEWRARCWAKHGAKV